MKKVLVGAAFFIMSVVLVAGYYFYHHSKTLISPLGEIVEKIKPKPLLSYSFENLQKTQFIPTQIIFGKLIDETDDARQQVFYFSVPKSPQSQEFLQVSGVANIPKNAGTYPVILMLRGFVPDDVYKPGVGTQPAASVFVRNKFITLAPDFLGFGESASTSADSFESRFQTYTTVLSLFSSLSTLNSGLDASYSGSIKADLTKTGIWAHSNGGHIALSTLAISGREYPTVLWAPVSKFFPYSILFYTDEADDGGKALRAALAAFESTYDTELFSPSNYYDWIKAPLSIHQGTADQEVLSWWSDGLIKSLKKDQVEVEYFTYPGADHNLRPNSWNSAVERSVEFYEKYFKK